MREKDVIEPVEVDLAMQAFPAIVIGKYLPMKGDIPEEFWGWHNPWAELVRRWFYKGLSTPPAFREGIDSSSAMLHLDVCIHSYEPKHEHKTAGGAYLMSLWCEDSEVSG